MQFENSYSDVKCPECCPECIETTAPHCSHCSRSYCPPYGEAVAVHLPNRRDYSHLVGDPAKQHDEVVHPVPSMKMLTDYDRLLLRFGMHIQW
jgi:hypothetical protein